MPLARDYETDVAIVDAGGAGIAAGIEARAAGARVIVIEQAPAPGGAAIVSGGGCLIVGSPLQKENGIDDTPDLAFADWMAWGGPTADAVWARYYIEHSLNDLYHWAESFGVRWLDLKVQEGNSVLRWTRPERNGLGLMSRLIDGLRAKGYGRSEFVQPVVTSLGETVALVRGVAVRYATTGSEMERVPLAYLMRRSEAGWKIAVLVAES